MVFDVRGEARVDLGQYVLPVIEGPHLADRLVSHPGHDAADLLQHRIGCPTLGPPILLGERQRVANGIDLAVLLPPS